MTIIGKAFSGVSSRRKALRMPGFELEVSYRTEFEDGNAQLINVSTSGCSLKNTTTKLTIKEKVLLSFRIDSLQQPVEIQAMVIRTGESFAGLEFLNVRESLKYAILCFFVQKNRQKNALQGPSR